MGHRQVTADVNTQQRLLNRRPDTGRLAGGVSTGKALGRSAVRACATLLNLVSPRRFSAGLLPVAPSHLPPAKSPAGPCGSSLWEMLSLGNSLGDGDQTASSLQPLMAYCDQGPRREGTDKSAPAPGSRPWDSVKASALHRPRCSSAGTTAVTWTCRRWSTSCPS